MKVTSLIFLSLVVPMMLYVQQTRGAPTEIAGTIQVMYTVRNLKISCEITGDWARPDPQGAKKMVIFWSPQEDAQETPVAMFAMKVPEPSLCEEYTGWKMLACWSYAPGWEKGLTERQLVFRGKMVLDSSKIVELYLSNGLWSCGVKPGDVLHVLTSSVTVEEKPVHIINMDTLVDAAGRVKFMCNEINFDLVEHRTGVQPKMYNFAFLTTKRSRTRCKGLVCVLMCAGLLYVNDNYTYLKHAVYVTKWFLFGDDPLESVVPSVPCSNPSAQQGSIKPKLILLSYMRSGSTYTGSLFSHSPKVFYWFEPLLYTHDVDLEPKGTSIRQRLSFTHPFYTSPPKVVDFMLTTLRCNLTERDLYFLYGVQYSRSLDQFSQCRKSLGWFQGLENCLHTLTAPCSKAQAVVAKTVRLKVDETDELLACDPDLKVIHLVRDPRGVSVSRRAMRYDFYPEPFCQRVSKDARDTEILQKKYPGRFLTIRYEDLVHFPVELTKMMYKFSRIDWTQDDEKRFIAEVKVKDPAKIAFKWRQSISYQEAKKLQDLCSEMFDIYGYVNFEDEKSLRDTSKSSFRCEYKQNLMKLYINEYPLMAQDICRRF